MRRKLSVIGAATALVVLGVVIGSLPTATGHGSNKDTLRFFAPYQFSTDEQIDVGASGNSDGDYFVGTFDLRKKGNSRGTLRFHCVRTNEGNELCHAAAWIKGKGNLSFIGSQSSTGNKIQVSIAGGTGAYSGVSGTGELDFGRAGAHATFTIVR